MCWVHVLAAMTIKSHNAIYAQGVIVAPAMGQIAGTAEYKWTTARYKGYAAIATKRRLAIRLFNTIVSLAIPPLTLLTPSSTIQT